MSLATQVLKYSSKRAVELWNLLKQAKDESDIEILTTSFLQHKSDQEVAIDAVAEVAEQIDAEIEAITQCLAFGEIAARKQYLVELHNRAIERLKSKKETIDKTIIKLYEAGAIATKTEGLSRTIKIQTNPPSCEVLIPTQDLPEEYRYEKVEIRADKKAITQAWKEGIEVEGTEVFQKQRVVYGAYKPRGVHKLRN